MVFPSFSVLFLTLILPSSSTPAVSVVSLLNPVWHSLVVLLVLHLHRKASMSQQVLFFGIYHQNPSFLQVLLESALVLFILIVPAWKKNVLRQNELEPADGVTVFENSTSSYYDRTKPPFCRNTVERKVPSDWFILSLFFSRLPIVCCQK